MSRSVKKLQRLTYSLLFLIMLVFVLIVAREFLYPIFMAVLFAYLLYPLVKIWERWGIPRIIANFFAIILSMALLVSLFVLLYKQLSVFLNDFPELQEQAMRNIDKLQMELEDHFGGAEGRDREMWLRKQIINAFEFSGGFISELLLAMTGTLTKFGLMPVYIFLMLYYRNKFHTFLLRVMHSENYPVTEQIINDISHVTKRYMSGVVIVILILCLINSTGLLLIGVEYAVLLGILSALMNFIPYFGTLIGGAIPLLYTLVVQGDPQKAFGVLGFFLLVQFTENNILTPNITGSQVNINPLFTILSIIVGGMIWGLPGMFVAVPFLGMFKIYCDHHKSMHPYAFLLGTTGTEEHALTWEKIKGWFRKKKQP
ncbi:AI-2E family transporter [Pontibacter sp. SGAir0037]|uniref:AI-2E family transporter n=1 Tax=Pontibacter sp. SGAir0037 TaxID=2571030 RepID=UPI0010CD0ABB|nr:AI-2E family transporter [Pontibacter sp. SGAir0037]QCR22009.1 AI-2E family transporter [Pontibacter sp. SGAir0037]